MGMPGGTIEAQSIRSDADTAAARLLVSLSEERRTENKAAAAVVHRVHAVWELRIAAEAAVHDAGGEEDLITARRAVLCEAAVALSISRTAVGDVMTVGEQLTWRLPAVDAAFTAGDLDYPRVRAIALILAKAGDSTVAALEADVLAAAQRSSVRSLREKIWAAWIRHDPKEAAAARTQTESEERCADIRRGDNGMANLFAKLSALEGAECDSVLDELVGTVCSRDPRTKRQLRAFALMALVHREEVIACLCGTGDLCPVRAGSEHLAPRRPHLLQITVDIETVLGLSGEPATLSDGTVLDPATARLLAENARWQGFLTEMLDAARAHTETTTADKTAPDGTAANETAVDDETTAADDSEESAADSDDPDEPEPEPNTGSDPDDPNPEPSPDPDPTPDPPDTGSGTRPDRGPRARRLLTRGRIRRAAPLPAPAAHQITGRSSTGREVALSDAIAAFLAAAALDPTLTQGIHPDGHGGHTTPPPGALTYRPTAEMVALTRATHPTCTFFGCTVPAARCEIDHIVPFDHNHPERGGWSITSNLQPLCHFHHQAKTAKLWAAAKIAGEAIYWTSTTGLTRITPSTYGTVTVPEDFVHNRPPRPPTTPIRTPGTTNTGNGTANPPRYVGMPDAGADTHAHTPPPCTYQATDEPPPELYEPTWWETNIGDTRIDWYDLANTDAADWVPSLGDIAHLHDPQAREDAIYLRERFLEHRAIVTARDRYRPPPF